MIDVEIQNAKTARGPVVRGRTEAVRTKRKPIVNVRYNESGKLTDDHMQSSRDVLILFQTNDAHVKQTRMGHARKDPIPASRNPGSPCMRMVSCVSQVQIYDLASAKRQRRALSMLLNSLPSWHQTQRPGPTSANGSGKAGCAAQSTFWRALAWRRRARRVCPAARRRPP